MATDPNPPEGGGSCRAAVLALGAGRLAYDPAVDFTPPAAPTTQKGRERREQILDAAAEAFAVQGYRNVSLASIAPVVGITAQGVMHYFPTKTDLLLGVLERRKEREPSTSPRCSASWGSRCRTCSSR